MKVIDVHTHIFPDAVAERAMAELERTSETKAFMRGTASELIESMKKYGVYKSVIAPIATKPGQVKSINNYVANQDKEYFIPLGSIHPDFKEIEEEAERMKSLKIPGIKMHSNYQEFFPHEERLFNLYRVMEENNFVILFHGGADISFEEVLATPEGMSIVLEKFPKLKIIAAHYGGWYQWKEVEKHLIGKNIWLDTSYTVPDIEPAELKRLIKKHGVERTVFGTDSPWREQGEEIKMIESLGFTDSELEKIFFENAKFLFRDFV